MSQNAKFSEKGYSISIMGKNLQVSDPIRLYIEEKLEKIERFANHILDIVVTLDVQKLTQSVSIVMKFLHFQIRVQASTEDLYSAIDKASDKLLNLIRKYKKRLQDHHNKDLTSIDMKVNVLRTDIDELEEINEQIEEENLKAKEKIYKFHEIVATETIPLKRLTQDEAVMKLELSGEKFLLFQSEEDHKLKVMYRRKDDNFGLIEAE